VSGPDGHTDVVVVGGGNAGFCAAHAAAERARRVVLLERAPRELAGGNSYYTAGATRIVHGGLDDLREFVEPDERHARTTVPPYPAEEFAADLATVTEGRNDPRMTELLVAGSSDTIRWLAAKGVRYRLMYERQAYERGDGHLFWGGLHVGNVDGGIGLIADHTRIAEAEGVDIRYGHRVTGFLTDGPAVRGVRYETVDGAVGELHAESVVLTCGGFESNAALREEHLGPGWANAKVRGTPFNTGELLLAALDLGAARGGDWATCHSVAWDAFAEHNESNRELTNRLTRQSYPLGIVVNVEGRRFLDEGADFRNYTYAKYGREILRQPRSVAFQIFDAALRPLLRGEEYDMPGISVVVADTVEDLAWGIGVDADALEATVAEFNAAIEGGPFDPTVKDGRRAAVTPPKSNWASPIAEPPFYAYPVTCGITFTFGGLKGDDDGRVLRPDGRPIDGLFVAGEALGGLFSGNYPGGTGLTAGMVFGRRAGAAA
jgi:tricarballylate dehydrogenase